MKIIAELCQNHNGEFDILQSMIAAAAQHGADVIKIQTIKANELRRVEKYESYRPYDAEYMRLKNLELSFDDEKRFIEICRHHCVEPMTTIFRPENFEYFNELGYKFLKLSGYSLPSFDYGLALKNYNFEKLFFSTSSLSLEETTRTVKNLREMKVDFTMLHCVCAYPTPLEKLNLQNIQFYKEHFELDSIGLSDHSDPHVDGLLSTKLAIFGGIDVVERHFTILGKDESRDGKVSITPDMLRELRRFSNLAKVEQFEEMNVFSNDQKFNHDFYRKRF